MKKVLIYFLLLFVIAACQNSEEENPQTIINPPHYKVCIHVLNEETGKTLLDPSIYPTLFVGTETKITAFCKGETFELSRFDDPRYNPKAPFRLEQYIENYGYRYRIVFDGFTIDKSFDEQLTIHWGLTGYFFEEFTTEISVSADVDYSGAEPKITRHLAVNGESLPCEEDKDWNVTILYKVKEHVPIDYPGLGMDATGKWEITDLDLSIDNTPSSNSPEEAVFWIHWLGIEGTLDVRENEVEMGLELLVNGTQYTVLIPMITISGGTDAKKKKYFQFNQQVTNAEIWVNQEAQTLTTLTVNGEMYVNDPNAEPTIRPSYVFAPQTNFYSDLEFYIECESCTLKLKMNYLRVIEDRGWM